jgi:hypothetical protein
MITIYYLGYSYLYMCNIRHVRMGNRIPFVIYIYSVLCWIEKQILVTRVRRQVSLVEQGLFTLPEHP